MYMYMCLHVHVHVYVQEAHVMITCVFICPIYVHVYHYTVEGGFFPLSTVLHALVFVTVFVVAKTMDDLTLWG